MSRYVSNLTLRLDSKGRVSIPASFRSVLGRDGFDGLYCYPALGLSGDRRRRERADGGDRGADRGLCAVFGRARTIRAGAVRHQRALKSTAKAAWAERAVEGACRRDRPGDVRGFRPQVSDLGTRPFSQRARGGHPKGARAQGGAWFPGGGTQCARSTGRTTAATALRLSLADQPATFPCSAAPLSNSSTCVTAASISTPPSAPAVTAAPCSRPPIPK